MYCSAWQILAHHLGRQETLCWAGFGALLDGGFHAALCGKHSEDKGDRNTALKSVLDCTNLFCLNGVPEVDIAFEHNLALVRPCVLSLEDHGVDNDDEADQAVRSNAERDSKVKILQIQSASNSSHKRKHQRLTGLSSLLNTVDPAIPPMPPNPTRVADANARFHWPRMLLAWYAMTVGIPPLAVAQMRKMPK